MDTYLGRIGTSLPTLSFATPASLEFKVQHTLPESEGALRVVGWKLDEGDGRAIHAPTIAALEGDWAASAVLAVFLLHDVLDYEYDEIAAVVGKSEDNCRQIALRARRQIEAKKPRFEASRQKREELSRRFFDAVVAGNTDGLTQLLATTVVAYADGGGKARAFPRPVYGREKVARLFIRARGLAVASVRHVEVNGQPGALLLDPDGRPVVVMSLDIADGLVQTVHAVSNPDKLRHLDPLRALN